MNTASVSAAAVRTAAKFGCTVEQAQRALDKNVAQLSEMRDRARSTGKKVNNYTADQLDAAIARLTAPADLPAVSPVKKPRRAKGPRIPNADPLNEVLAELDEKLSYKTNQEGEKYSQRDMILALRALVARDPQPSDYQVVLSSVGNPDFGQYHREGVLSPTVIVSAPTLAEIVKAHDAYTAIFQLGGGNCPHYRVFLKEVEVAHVSYNGRLWTPNEFGTPEHKEIDVATGRIIS